jgi:osmotically inducible protein OsmC
MAIERDAHATWEGSLRNGSGRFDLESSGAITGETVTFASRFEQPGGKTSPEELIAAAHASCFSMALSGNIGRAGGTVRSLDVTADVDFGPDEARGGYQISRIHLTVRGQVDGLDAEGFREAAEGAKTGCPVSKALAAVPEITLDAALA